MSKKILVVDKGNPEAIAAISEDVVVANDLKEAAELIAKRKGPGIKALVMDAREDIDKSAMLALTRLVALDFLLTYPKMASVKIHVLGAGHLEKDQRRYLKRLGVKIREDEKSLEATVAGMFECPQKKSKTGSEAEDAGTTPAIEKEARPAAEESIYKEARRAEGPAAKVKDAQATKIVVLSKERLLLDILKKNANGKAWGVLAHNIPAVGALLEGETARNCIVDRRYYEDEEINELDRLNVRVYVLRKGYDAGEEMARIIKEIAGTEEKGEGAAKVKATSGIMGFIMKAKGAFSGGGKTKKEARAEKVEILLGKGKGAPSSLGLPKKYTPVVCSFSPKGGVGKSFIAVNLASTYAALGAETLLLDLDIDFGGLGSLVPGQTYITDLIENIDNVKTKEEFRKYVTPHTYGLDTVPMIPLVDKAGQIDPTDIQKILIKAAKYYDIVVADCSISLNHMVTVHTLRASDLVLLVTTDEKDAYGRTLKALMQLHANKRMKISHFKLLVNEAKPNTSIKEKQEKLDKTVNAGKDDESRLMMAGVIPYDKEARHAWIEAAETPVFYDRTSKEFRRSFMEIIENLREVLNG